MGYGLYNVPPPSSYMGGGYSPNSVTSSSAEPTYGGGAGASAFDTANAGRGGVQADTTPASAGSRYDGGSSDSGMGAGGWMAIFQMIGDKLEGRRAAQAAAAAAGNDIPEDPKWMRPFLDEMAVEGVQLKNSALGARPMMEANAAGHAAATSRGLSGPLAATVQADSVGRAQGQYDKWRQGALMSHRQAYMERVGQYMKAIQAHKAAKQRAEYAQREAWLAKLPVGPIGAAIGRSGMDNGWWGGLNAQNRMTGYSPSEIEARSDYHFAPPSAY